MPDNLRQKFAAKFGGALVLKFPQLEKNLVGLIFAIFGEFNFSEFWRVSIFANFGEF